MYRAGRGPAVVVVHAIPGILPEVVRFARWVLEAGFTVYMPSLFGTPLQAYGEVYAASQVARACISREFSVFATQRSSPVVAWLRALARDAFAECGGHGVGAIGMCLTGNFALEMMVEPFMLAPVLSQPALPFGFGAAARRALGLSPAEIDAARARIACDGAKILGFACLRETFGAGFEAHELDAGSGKPRGARPAHVMARVCTRIRRRGRPCARA